MATICGKINMDIARNCEIPLQSGTRDLAKIINLDDIIGITYDSTNKAQVKDVTLASGASAFTIDGISNSIRPQSMLVDGTYSKLHDHQVEILGFDISPEMKEHFNAGISGRYVVITQNYFQGEGGESAFEIYGLTSGMEFTVLNRNANDTETQGAYAITFLTKNNKEPKLPNAFFDTDYATTKALFDAL
jgi:hypothetical protein